MRGLLRMFGDFAPSRGGRRPQTAVGRALNPRSPSHPRGKAQAMSQSSPPEAAAAPARRSIVPIPPRYAVIRQIGAGGMASIWAAEDQVLGRCVAVKVLAEHLAEEPRFVQRFEREARLAASLSGHAHVITIYDVGEYEGRPFIVMEYLSGGTLADRLRSGRRPSRRESIRWLEQAASAIDFA